MADMIPYRIPLIKDKKLIDPHVIIVGAGASIAACRKDKNGMEVPLLRNIHKILGLTPVLERYIFSEAEMEDFELLYSSIHNKTEFAALTNLLEESIRAYFESLVIPDEVTYYDYLILSLTSKDAIISFNWDPFLLQAYQRNLCISNLPNLIFPHGNVGVGLCDACHIKGYANSLCPNCMKDLKNMPLLFPVGEKNYNKQPIIKNEWDLAKDFLSKAAGITVYGFGAPETDTEALELMKSAYQESNVKEIAPFTIINLRREKDNQMRKWKDFISSRMVLFYEKIEESLLWQNPRVSLETLFDAILQQHPRENSKPYKAFNNLKELQDFVKTINEYEIYF